MPLAVRAARVGTPSLRSIAYGRLAVRFGSGDMTMVLPAPRFSASNASTVRTTV